MRRAVHISICLLAAWTARAEVLDRVVVAAGEQVVTLSAVRRQLRLEAVVARQEPEYSPSSMRKAAERLIEQALVLREMELSRFVPPGMAEADATLAEFIRGRNQTAERFAAQLAARGFTEDEFRKEILWRLSVQRFVDFRFAPGVQVSDGEIEAYYNEELESRLKASTPNAKVPPLDEVRDTIMRILITRKTNTALESWMAQTRTAMKVRFFEEALKP